jgi:Raf kinase inhibitor-like YbhB/YbcL family protein
MTDRHVQTRRRTAVVLAGLAAVVVAGCDGDVTDELPAGEAISVESPAFDDGGDLPVDHTCDGADHPPALTWSGVPDEAVEVVVVVTDPDAPGGDFVHWLVAGIDPEAGGLDGGALPDGAVEGTNDFGDPAWAGPCPPVDEDAHDYVFAVVALDTDADLAEGFTAGALESIVDVAEVARGELTGRFDR